MARSRKPKAFELMFMDVIVSDRVDFAVVQIGDDPTEALTAAEARRFAAWLIRAAEWIDGREKK